MKNDILLSIIVPVYNTENYISECLASVELNKREDIELIIIDDGSTDGSTQKCKDFLKKYPKNTILKIQKNSGVSIARNKGIDLARGEYLLFLDSDDKIMPGALDMVDLSDNADLYVFNYCSKEELSNCIGSNHFDRIKNSVPYCEKALYPYRDVDGIQAANYTTPWSKIYKKSIIVKNNIKFQPKVKMGEDMLFNIDYLMNIQYIKFYSFELYYQETNRLDSAIHKKRSEKDQLEDDLRYCRASKKTLFKYENLPKYLYYDKVIVNFVDEWLQYRKSLIDQNEVSVALENCSNSSQVLKRKLIAKMILSKNQKLFFPFLKVIQLIKGKGVHI